MILADAWQESEKTRALLNFLEKTRGALLVHEVTVQEVIANLERRWRTALEAANAAADDLARLRLTEAPRHDVKAVVEAAKERWFAQARKPVGRKTTIPIDTSLLPELVRRSAGRIPPCARKGEEFRDALMWLGALKHCAAKSIQDLVFVSSNTRDFAGSDGRLLSELLTDAEEHGVRVSYFPSLDAFLKDYAEPLEWLTLDWVVARLDHEAVRELIWEVFKHTDPKDYDLAWKLQEGWQPLGGPEVTDVRSSLVSVPKHSPRGDVAASRGFSGARGTRDVGVMSCSASMGPALQGRMWHGG